MPRDQTAFAKMDRDANGVVTLEETRKWWEALPASDRAYLPEGMTIDDAFKDADKNRDGEITFEESGCAVLTVAAEASPQPERSVGAASDKTR